MDYQRTSHTDLSELYELEKAPIPPLSDINFHSWEQITAGNQIIWQGKLTAQLRDFDDSMKHETVEAQGSSKKAVKQELATKMLEIISRTFKRPATCKY